MRMLRPALDHAAFSGLASVARVGLPWTSTSTRSPAPRRRLRPAPLLLAVAAAAALLAGILPAAAGSAEASIAIAYDVSWPNCSAVYPAGTVLSIVGVTGGRAFTKNPCFRSEYLAARRRGGVQLYININAPQGTAGLTGPAGSCSRTNLSCQAYNYGYKAAAAAWAYASSQIGSGSLTTRWWLDVELGNRWSSRTSVNAESIAGALAYLRHRVGTRRLGAYSTNYQWRVIAGRFRPGVAVWYATVARRASAASAYCRSAYAFTGGAVHMVQYLTNTIDHDYICP